MKTIKKPNRNTGVGGGHNTRDREEFLWQFNQGLDAEEKRIVKDRSINIFQNEAERKKQLKLKRTQKL